MLPRMTAEADDHLIDLASRALGGSVLAANDETYAEKENLIKVAAPTFTPKTMGPRGQVYDGWETRRRRDQGSDWVILRLGVPGVVHRVVVDTAFVLGNYPAECDIETCWLDGWPAVDELTALPYRGMKAGIQPDTRHWFGRDAGLDTERTVDRVRVELHPDGGLDRLRLWCLPSGKGRSRVGLRWWNLPGGGVVAARTVGRRGRPGPRAGAGRRQPRVRGAVRARVPGPCRGPHGPGDAGPAARAAGQRRGVGAGGRPAAARRDHEPAAAQDVV
jgi:Allantoicase repeat